MLKAKTNGSAARRCWSALLAALAIALMLAGCYSNAATITVATVTVTNAAGTTNGQTFTVNSDTRTWTNNVFAPGTQILTNNTAAGSATNLFNQLVDSPLSTKVNLNWSATNAITVQTLINGTITVTLSAGWGTVTYSTNTFATAAAVRVPTTVEAAAEQTNINSGLVAAIDSSGQTNAIHESSPVAVNLVGITNAQTVTGNKAFTGSSNYLAGAYLPSPKTTNLVNYGSAISSPGSYSSSEQFGQTATATNSFALAVGNGAIAGADSSTAIGANSLTTGQGSVALGSAAQAITNRATALGTASSAAGVNSTAVGYLANTSAGHTNSTAVGCAAATTAPNQVMLGSAGISVVVNNALQVGGGAIIANGVTNLLHTGTNNFPAGADVSFGRYALSTLATGNNAGVAVGTNVFVEVSGPGGAFTINGINGSPNRDGKFLILLNRTGQNMTIANNSGVEPTAANRIVCLTGADKTVTGNSSAMLIYSGAASLWICLYFGQ